MKAFIIGASGQIGKKLISCLTQKRQSFTGTGFRRTESIPALDIRDSSAVTAAITTYQPTHVFLTAALTHVDYCEDHADEARAINVTGTKNVVEACRKAGAQLTFLSTEYVFDGMNGPYREADKTNPINVYGKTKLEGEELVLGLPGSLVVRTTVVYDWDLDSKNFIMGLISILSAGKQMKVVSDQWSHPTLAENLAEILIDLAEKKQSGVFNVVGPDYLNRYEFAQEAVKILGFNPNLLESVLTKDVNQKAARPLRAGLNTDKVRSVCEIPLVGVHQGLKKIRQRLSI